MRVLFVTQQIDYEPQGIMHLSSALKAAGHQVALAVEAHEDPVAVAREFRPGIVGYTVITGSQQYYLQLNRRIKQEIDVFSAFGGPHPTFFPEMIEEEGVDGICIGEGEEAIVDLANVLEDGGPGGLQNPSIPNWHFKLNGEIVRNPVRPYVDDLDSLPLPDRDLVYNKDPTTSAARSSTLSPVGVVPTTAPTASTMPSLKSIEERAGASVCAAWTTSSKRCAR